MRPPETTRRLLGLTIVLLAGGHAWQATVTADAPCKPCIYVANQGSNSVTVIDGATGDAVLNIPAGNTPQFVAAHPDGTRVYVSTHAAGTQGAVTVIDAAALSVIATIPVGPNPTGLAVNAAAHQLYVLNSGDNTMSLIDTNTNAVVSKISVGAQPYDIAVSPDGKRFYVSAENAGAVQVFDVPTKNLLKSIPIGKAPAALALNASGQLLFVADFVLNQVGIIDTTTLQVTGSAPAGKGAIALALGGTGSVAYTADFGSNKGATVSIIDTAAKTNTGTVTVGKSPHGLVLDGNAGRLYVSNLAGSDVSVVDTAKKMEVARIPSGAQPLGLAMVAAGSSPVDACSKQITAATPYNMDDPQWFANTNLNKDTCAYQFLAALHMLGYNTAPNPPAGTSGQKDQLAVLHVFQTQNGLPASDLLTSDALAKITTQLAAWRTKIAAVAKTFPLRGSTEPLHPHDVSKDWVAYLYQLPMTSLPAYLQMDAAETRQCVWGQCVGFLLDPNGKMLPCQQSGCYTFDPTLPSRFIGAYFDARPASWSPRLPSASSDVATVLHEYAHYLDGTFHALYAALPHQGLIDTHAFYDINYDMSKQSGPCAPKRTTNPKDWITRYSFTSNPSCSGGLSYFLEEWADAFSVYVQDGQGFRAAAQQNAIIAKAYAWLKTKVFKGVEYNTHGQRDFDSGCSDAPGTENAQPGYTTCSTTAVWDGTIPVK